MNHKSGGTMLGSIRRRLSELKRSTSGNATLLVAAGIPSLIGASGLAVDSAQYYMWRRELQFAVDQAALAGAWAKTNTATATNYSARAQQEYAINMQAAGSFDSTPVVSTVTVSGTQRVKVTSSASKLLPFTNIITGRPVTVNVEAQASFVAAVAGTSTTNPAISACMIALDPHQSGAFTIGGSAGGTVTCGGATLSDHPTAAIQENGNPSTQFNSLAAAGGIASSLLDNVGNVSSRLRSNQTGMTDPFAGIATPTGNGISRTYSCPTASAGTTSYTVNGKRVNTPTYKYFVGSASATATENTTYSGTGTLANPAETDVAGGAFTLRPVAASPVPTTGNQATTAGVWSAVDATYFQITAPTAKKNGGLNSDGVWRRLYTRQIDKYTQVNSTLSGYSDGIARPQPGTYASIIISCTTQFAPGIYVVTGALNFSNNQTITGSDLMFVMTSANNVSNINSNTNITLSGITSNTLINTYSYSAANAAKLAKMLWWDKLSTTQIKWNGNSQTVYDGALYMPNRQLWFNGTAQVAGRCMMLIANTLMFDGNVNMSSFCTSNGGNNFEVKPVTTTTTAGTPASVKLVV